MAVAARSLRRFAYSLGPDVAEFFARNYRHTKGPMIGEPFRLEAPQQAYIDEAFRCDSQGRRAYRTALYGLPRGNGKTPISAGLAVRDIRVRRDAPDVYFGSASKEEARDLKDFAGDMVEQGPLSSVIDVQTNLLRCDRTRGTLKLITADGALQHGKSPAGWYEDETHAYSTPKQREQHTAMISALFKREDSFAQMTTTAGWNKQTLLGEMFDEAMRGPVEDRNDGYLLVVRDVENGSLVWWHQVPDGVDIEDPEVLRRANPASWIDVGDMLRTLHAAATGIGESEFRRLHCNQWTDARAVWIPAERWSRCEDSSLVTPMGVEMALAVDASYSHDTTAVGWAWRLEDGRIGVGARVWSAREDAAAHDYQQGGKIHMEPVRSEILERGERFLVGEVGFDPAYFRESADMLEEQGVPMVRFDQQSAAMRGAEQDFYSAVMEGRIVHDGDPILRRHLAAVIATRRPNGAWRIRPVDQVSAIDAVPAVVMAVSRLVQMAPQLVPLVAWR